MKKITSYLLVAVMLLALIPFSAFSVSASADVDTWDGTVSPFEYGSGTEDDPYLITTAAEFAYFAQSVNSGYSYKGEYIKLETNIKLNDETFTFDADTGLVGATDGTNVIYIGTDFKGDKSGENTVFDTTASKIGSLYTSKDANTTGTYGGTLRKWILIGNSGYPFSGNFDGGNHYISGLYRNTSSSSTTYNGLFGYVSDAVIKNVCVVNSFLAVKTTDDYYLYAGSIIGYMLSGVVENCYFDSSVIAVSSYSYSSGRAGGIVGRVYSSSADTKINKCYNTSYLLANSECSLGGIVGETYVSGNAYKISISNCYNSGLITKGYRAGGIVGYSDSYSSSSKTNITNCYNVANIYGSSHAGGIVGYAYYSTNTSCSNCYYKIGCATIGSTIAQGVGTTDDSYTKCKSYTAGNLKKQENFVGFDFDTVWTIDPNSEYPYPTLIGLPFGIDCVHNYEDTVVAPKCNDKGYTLHTCTKCGDKYEDSFVSATGHAYEDSVTAPTCTEQGYTTHTCSTCGDSYVDSYVSSNGHKTNAVTDCNTAKVCSVCGTTVESAKGHNYVDKVTAPTCTAQGYTTHTCSACGDSYTDSYVRSNGHAAGEKADCTHDQICTSCGETLVEALGHTEGEWKIVVEATVGEKGLMEQYCADCGTILDSKEIPALDGGSVSYSLGDVNADKKVDSVDYLLVKRACFKTYTLSEEEAVRADVNVDKKVDSTDYLLIKRIAFGTYKINQLTYTMN